VEKLTGFVQLQSEALEAAASPETLHVLQEEKKRLKIDYLLQDVRDLIDESAEGTERIQKIVQNLKTFSRIDGAEIKDANLNDCIETTLNIVWNELKYKTTVAKDYGEIPLVKCYPQQINQVIMNLLVNAGQAIEERGEIKIKTWAEDGAIKMSISDTGSGIPEAKLDRIFEPFYTTKAAGKGTGLGLSISYDIVKKHNGEMTVSSVVGKGTTFVVTIPVRQDSLARQ
jgi:two-component system NtrC family sensor kinase